MGNKACQCLYQKDDVKNMQIEKTERKSTEHIKKSPKLSSEEQKFYAQNTDKAIKIQSHYRGYMARKKIGPELATVKQQPRVENSISADTTQRQSRKEVDVIPDYSNSATRETEQKLGSFRFDKLSAEESRNLIEKPPFELDNGAIYIGQWNKTSQREGRGIQLWPDGSKYTGYWRNDMANGRGRLIHADGDVYEGDWLDDKADGNGTYIHVDGSQYTGQWKDDKQHGHGVETWADGARYEGNYEYGKKHGKGKFHWSDNSTYDGDFFNNNIHGFGVYVWSDGRRYEGEWRNNKMEGKGVFTWSDGRKYVGEYLDDKKHGQGEFTWPDGRRYVGGWTNGKQHGRGLYTSSDGRTREGEWKEGKRVKWTSKSEET